MANIFKLYQVVSKNKYNKGIATTQRFDVVDLGKPGADDWFKLYTFTEQGLDNFPPVMICKTKDPEGKLNPYLIGGSEDFKAACAEKLPRVQYCHLTYGITTHKRLFVWPVVYVEDVNEGIGWHVSAYEIAGAAFSRWTQIRSDKPNSRYIHLDLDDQDQVPKEKVFETPPIDYETALNKAFKNRYISSEDHPVYKNAGSVLETNFQKMKMKGVVKS
jgi:hypothetical protein